MASPLTVVYEFARFRLDRGNRRLTRDGLLLSTPGATFPILLMLIENRDHVVSTQKLINEFFPRSSFPEEELAAEILKLKQLLDDSSKQSPIIRTIAGQGYQFEVEVEEFLGDSAADEKFGSRASRHSVTDSSPSYSAESAKKKSGKAVGIVVGLVLVAALGLGIWRMVKSGAFAGSTDSFAGSDNSSGPADNAFAEPNSGGRHVAVLPFQSLSGSAGDDQFNQNLTSALLQALSTAKVDVVSQDAVKNYLQSGVSDPITAGHQLGAQMLVHGMAQRLAGRILVKVQLVNTRDGSQLWSDGLDADQNNVAALAGKIAKKISQTDLNGDGAKP